MIADVPCPSSLAEHGDETADSDAGSIKLPHICSSDSTLSQESLALRDRLFLHFEILDSKRHRAGQALFLFMFVFAACVMGTALYMRIHEKEDMSFARITVEQQKALHKSFLVVASILLSGSTIMASFCIRSYFKTRKCSWSRRQRYLVTVAHLKLYLQILDLVFWILPNSAVMVESCHLFSLLTILSFFVRVSCWNSISVLQVIHIRNAKPALKKADDKESGCMPRVNDPRYGNNKRDPMILDGEVFREHWLVLILWVIGEAFICGQTISGAKSWYDNRMPEPAYCSDGVTVPHNVTSMWRKLVIADGMALILYQIFVGMAPRIYAVTLNSQSYSTYQFANMLVLWQRRQSLWLEVLAIIDIWNLVYNSGTLMFYIQSLFGQMCFQVILTTSSVLDAFYLLPMEPRHEEHIYQALLQDFVWTREEVQRRRRQFHTYSPGFCPDIARQPVFCMQTALELCLWSNICYETGLDGHQPALSPQQNTTLNKEMDFSVSKANVPGEQTWKQLPIVGDAKQPTRNKASKPKEAVVVTHHTMENVMNQLNKSGRSSSGVTASTSTSSSFDMKEADHTSLQMDALVSSEEQLKLGMNAFDLTDLKIFAGLRTDTKAILAWSKHTAVLAFRGTSSFTNVKSDVKAWRTQHLPARGSYWMGTSCLVHEGFQRAWMDVREEVLSAIDELLQDVAVSKKDFEFYVTGHSLGSSLAILAAWAIQDQHHLPNLTCYTYGSPRPGNHAFAKEFRHMVPNMYHIINDRDAVPKTGKFIWLYKRPGQRVLINSRGDIRVRPSLFEISLHSGGFSVSKHYLASYLDALGAICVAQLIRAKTLDGGLEGVRKLSEIPTLVALLSSCGIDIRRMLESQASGIETALRRVSGSRRSHSKFRSNLAAFAREMMNMPLPMSTES